MELHPANNSRNSEQDFIDRITYALNSIKESNQKIAEKLGVNKKTIALYKQGKGVIKGHILEGLFEIYNFNPAWLFTGKEPIKFDAINENDSLHNLIDANLLNSILSELYILYADEFSDTLSFKQIGNVSALLYKYFIKTGQKVNIDVVRRYMRLSAG